MGNLVCSFSSSTDLNIHNSSLILVVGERGSGKSATLNTIFSSPGLFPVRETDSEDEDVYQTAALKIEVQPPFGNRRVKNFTVCEFPGFEVNIENNCRDNRTVATIHELLDSNKPLEPAFLFIIARADDNRIDGEYSRFVQILKRIRLIPFEFLENLQIVLMLTHSANVLMYVNEKGNEYKRLTALHLRLDVKQIKIGCFENNSFMARRIDTEQLILCPGQNTAEVLTILADPKTDVQFTRYDGSQTNHYIPKASGIRKANLLPLESILVKKATESENLLQLCGTNSAVLNLVDSFYKKCTLEKNNKDLDALVDLIHKVRIYTSANYPQGDKEIAWFLKILKPSPCSMYVISEGLKWNIPTLNQYSVYLGRGFNIKADKVAAPIFESSYSAVNISGWGYLLPDYVKCVELPISDQLKPTRIYYNSNNWASLEKLRLKQLQIPINMRPNTVDVTCRQGYNNVIYNGSRTALQEFRVYKLDLDQNKTKIRHEVGVALNGLPKFDASNDTTLYAYTKFFERYGTHVISRNYAGGYIFLTAQAESSCFGDSKSLNINKAFTRVDKLKKADTFRQSNWLISSRVVGEIPNKIASSYSKSKYVAPAMLDNDLSLRPLHELVKTDFPDTADQLKKAYIKLLRCVKPTQI